MYEGINKKYINDFEARKDLQVFFNSGNDFELNKNSITSINLSDDIFNGVFVYLVVKEPNRKIENIKKIHSLNYINESDLFDEEVLESLKGLMNESEIYKKSNLQCNSTIIDLKDIGGEKTNIMCTPFDWNLFLLKNKGCNLFH